VIAVAATRFLTSILFHVTTDPAAFRAALAMLFWVAIAACLIPARRVTLIDPAVAQRPD